MAKQVKVEHSKKSGKTVNAGTAERGLVARSPKTNLFFAALLGLIYLAIFNQNAAGAFVYAIGAFLFFCTVDYCILYYRLKKKGDL